jgi:TolB-like protein/class 3 adenylate cyclase/Flp pilus assembly protein TadD
LAEEQVERRLAAIMAVDVVGYSRLMEVNEEGTLGALRQHRREFFEPTVAKHGGRIFKVMGDGFLVEFGSVINAARCAVEIQTGMHDRNAGIPEDRQVKFRIGINVGDIIVEGDDFYGDGVNLASRLEALAGPGGIACSAMVRHQIGNKLEIEFVDHGEKTVKNLTQPVHVYFINFGSPTGASSAAATPGHDGQLADPLYIGSLASVGQGLLPKRLMATPTQRSIAVLPFVNMGGDAEQESFTDGLTEDIITDLSNVPDFFVIARNSTFAYKGKPTDVRQIARDLGVKYVLEGSARRSDKRLRVNVQLVNAGEGGNHVWAERFDREIADIFEVQDEVTRRVVEAISGKIGANNISVRSRPSNLDAYDLCVRSRDKWSRSKSDASEATSALERAVALDPNYCEAHSNLALSLLLNWMTWGGPQIPDRGNALMHAQRAVDIDPNDSGALSVLGYIHLYERNWDEAKSLFDAAIRLNPNNADAVAWMAELHVYLGQPQEALSACAEALRLNPRPPHWYFWLLGIAQIAAGRYEEAVATLSREETYGTASREALIPALALAGRVPEAREEARLFLAGNPDWRIGESAANSPFRSMSAAQPLIDGWRLAGMPD